MRSARVNVEVGAALNLVGALLKYLSLAFLFPIALAIGYSEPVWPFVASGAVAGLGGWGLELATRGKQQVGIREGFLVVALTWLLGAAVVGVALPALRRGSVARPVDDLFEAMSGMTTTGSSVLTDIPGLAALAADVAAVQPVARRDGDHRPRARRPAAAPGRRAPADGVGGSGPGTGDADGIDPGHGAPPLVPLRRPDGAHDPHPRHVRMDRDRRADAPVRRGRRTPSRRCRRAASASTPGP